jgi:hypothetical protein
MKGTEKQIAWAEDIKQKYILAIDSRINEIKESKSRRMTEEMRAEQLEEAEGFREWMLAHDEAVFWINNRNLDAFRPWYGHQMKMMLADYNLLKQEGRV